MDWLNGISITCFAASYLVVFGLELSRIFFNAPLRRWLVPGLMIAGLFAHSVFLVLQTGLVFSETGIWTGSWSTWSLAAAWVLAVACLWIMIRRAESIGGVFLLPVILAIVALGTATQGVGGSFSTSGAKSVWGGLHGLSLLLGTAVVALGFALGVMYLLQARRLKKKQMPSGTLRLPSLEWLQISSERSLVVSAILLGAGLVSGLVVNLINNRTAEDAGAVAAHVVPWNDPVVWSSGILFLWLLAALLFNLLYRPARQGRKVAYLVVASFLFLVLELGIVLWAGHARVPEQGQAHNGNALARDKSRTVYSLTSGLQPSRAADPSCCCTWSARKFDRRSV